MMRALRTSAFAALLCVFAGTGAMMANAYTSPGAPQGYVSDFAGILSQEEQATLSSEIAEYARPAGVQIAIATIPSLGDETIETYAVQLFKEWGIGNKISDNGILFLIAPNDRSARIEVGYGLEGTVTDADASLILRTDVIPAFAEGKYYQGISVGLNRIEGLISADPTTLAYIEQEKAAEARAERTKAIVDVVFWIVFVIVISFLSRRRRGRGSIWPWIFWGGFGGPRGGFGGGRGGGFGGFGGGGSGGGGASGRW